jgi:hypothetical protein
MVLLSPSHCIDSINQTPMSSLSATFCAFTGEALVSIIISKVTDNNSLLITDFFIIVYFLIVSNGFNSMQNYETPSLVGNIFVGKNFATYFTHNKKVCKKFANPL